VIAADRREFEFLAACVARWAELPAWQRRQERAWLRDRIEQRAGKL
jgi:hypothetical protein